MQELEQTLLLRIELFKRMALNPRNKRRYEPLRLAHLDHGDDRAILFKGGEGSAWVKTKMSRHGALHR